MRKEEENEYVKRTQKDYPMSLKLQIVNEVESGQLKVTQAKNKYGIQGRSTVLIWLRKYGNFDWETKSPFDMKKTPEQRLMEYEQEVRLLKKQKKLLEKQLDNADKKSIIFDMMIDIAEEEYKIPIRKNYSPGQSIKPKRNKK